MLNLRVLALLSALALLPPANAVSWSLTTKASGEAFLDLFNFSDGTQVAASASNWTTEANARAMGLVTVNKKTGVTSIRTDAKNKYPGGLRPTVRLESKELYGDGVIILEVAHFPTGCATWPSWWARPKSASFEEIDMYENVNGLFPRGASIIHTRSTCHLRNATQTGKLELDSCSSTEDNTDGCRVNLQPSASAAGASAGMTIAMERNFGAGGKGVRTWYWPRGKEPKSARSTAKKVDPDQWGTPSASFPIQECEDSAFVEPHMLVLTQSLCGKWTNTTYADSGCTSQAATCVDLVKNSPQAFAQAYWDIASLRIYGGDGSSSGKSSLHTVSAVAETRPAMLATVSSLALSTAALVSLS